MKVRYLSGNKTGFVEDLPQLEAEAAISTGFAEPVEAPAEKVAAEPKPEKSDKPERPVRLSAPPTKPTSSSKKG